MISKGRTDTPSINGLVLAGGKSTRMGQDKGRMKWHQKEQRYYLADLLSHYCIDVFISCRIDQQQEIDPAYRTLPDTYTGLGPYGGILSAFRYQPDSAWLVVACDLPLIDDAALSYLLQHRDPAAVATTFKSSHDGLPETLFTIWEPRSHQVLLSFLDAGNRCTRKV